MLYFPCNARNTRIRRKFFKVSECADVLESCPVDETSQTIPPMLCGGARGDLSRGVNILLMNFWRPGVHINISWHGTCTRSDEDAERRSSRALSAIIPQCTPWANNLTSSRPQGHLGGCSKCVCVCVCLFQCVCVCVCPRVTATLISPHFYPISAALKYPIPFLPGIDGRALGAFPGALASFPSHLSPIACETPGDSSGRPTIVKEIQIKIWF